MIHSEETISYLRTMIVLIIFLFFIKKIEYK
jgi:hypothetical protein